MEIESIDKNVSTLNEDMGTITSRVKNLEKINGIVEKTVGNFVVSDDELCTIEGLPAVYFFSTTTCPHCKWEKPIIESVATKFEGLISFRSWELDRQEHPQEDYELFKVYNPKGSVPTLVLGCEYYRVGSGESLGEEAEEKALTQIFCELTGNNPEELCNEIFG